MNIYDKVKELADIKKISIRKLERELGFSNASLKRWNDINPGSDKLEKVADYFEVSVDYLLGRYEKNNREVVTIDSILNSVENFSGKPLNNSDREMLRLIIQSKSENK